MAPHICQHELRGGLYSETEMAVIPDQAALAIIKWLQKEGVIFHFETPVTQVHDDSIVTSDGTSHPFDRLAICTGDEIRLLFPDELRAAPVVRCKLQMMSTVPQHESWHLGPIAASELTLRHYASFQTCTSLGSLRRRLAKTWPDQERHGIHVLAVQRPTGELILGDSHEYGSDFLPHHSEQINQFILNYLNTFLEVENLQIVDRWNGYYLKTTTDKTETILEPKNHVHLVTGLGGAGLTLSFGLAEELIASWN